MPRTAWVCEKCFSAHETEEKANECEASHPKPEDLTILGCHFDQAPLKPRPGDLFRAQRVPRTIFLRWGDGYSQVAEYKLNHVWPRGV